MSEAPLVTVVICTYNAGPYLRASIQSVVDQTYRNLEVLVVDDGSTDGSVDKVKRALNDSRIRWLSQANAGKPVALNRALDEMRGDFYALNDADDLSHPKRIERQVMCLQENAHVAAVYTGYELILDGRRMAPRAKAKDEEACQRDIAAFVMPSHDPTGMYRRAAVVAMRYAPELRIGQGYDYVLRVGEHYPMLVIGECLYGYRIHVASVTKRDPQLRDRMVRDVLVRACERRGLSLDSTFPTLGHADKGYKRRDANNNLAADFIESVCWQRTVGQIKGAMKTGLQCALLRPAEVHYWKAMAYALLPQAAVRRIRRPV